MTGIEIQNLLSGAVDAHRRGESAAAENGYRAVLARDPDQPDALNLLSIICASRGEIAAAVSMLERAIKIKPGVADFHFNLGNFLSRPGASSDELKRASESYGQALELNPEHADAHTNLGSLLKRTSDHDGALAVFRAMTERFPGDFRGHYNLGLCFLDLGEYQHARDTLRLAIELAPQAGEAHLAMSDALSRSGDFAGAVESARQAVSIGPPSAAAWTSLGTALADACRWDEALAAYDRALTVEPHHLSARVNRGLARLRHGVSPEAWSDYEVRYDDPDFSRSRFPRRFPTWRGESLAGRHILVIGDQGIGDQILYASMLPDLERVARVVTLACDSRLTEIFARSFPRIRCLSHDDLAQSVVGPDVQSSLIDLGQWLRPRMSAFPNRRAYLRAGSKMMRKPEKKSGILRIGFSWRSSRPDAGRDKTIDLPLWRPLFESIDAKWTCLQYGTSTDDLAALKAPDGTSDVEVPAIDTTNDIDGLAELMSKLDLVITVSNTTAHLAGALGIPTWVMVPAGRGGLWYWFDRGGHSPWYPSLRVYRAAPGRPLADTLTLAMAELRTLTGSNAGSRQIKNA